MLLLLVILIWIAAVAWASRVVSSKIVTALWRLPIAAILFLAILPLPVIDEIVAKPQFESLCKANSQVTVDAKTTSGRTVWFESSERKKLSLGMLDVTQVKRTYVDAKTQELIYHYFRFEATGGWLIRHLGISEGDSPLLFRGVCQPGSLETIDAELGLTRINRPTSNGGKK